MSTIYSNEYEGDPPTKTIVFVDTRSDGGISINMHRRAGQPDRGNLIGAELTEDDVAELTETLMRWVGIFSE